MRRTMRRTMNGIEIPKAEKTKLYTKPVFIDGIMQKTLKELTGPCDVVINGLTLRLPVGSIISVVGGGSNGIHGSLMSDVDFIGVNGQTYRATQGMALLIPESR